MKYDVVIGAAYGDERKGGTVADLALGSNKCVVTRFNGGCQAGHTVEYDGQRHVFGHFGSGTLVGAATFLSKHFVSNPYCFNKELEELEGKKQCPQVFIDRNGMISTIFDLATNISLERSRGNGRHGSCGMGIGETIQRNTHPEFSLTWKDFQSPGIHKKLDKIRFEYLPFRYAELNLDVKEFPYYENADEEELFADSYYLDCMTMLGYKHLKFVEWDQVANDHEHMIFEGAQGLQLDQDHGTFPHVTRSNTGLKNVVDLLGDEYEELNVYYATRAYTTRHGAGPLPHELEEAPHNIVDPTNAPNEFQGSLRFSHLNFDTLADGIHNDVELHGTPKMKYHGVISCCDQLVHAHNNIAKYIENGEVHPVSLAESPVDVFVEKYGDLLESNSIHCTFSPETTE